MPVYTLDIYQGWTRERLKDRCMELCRAVDDWQQIAMALAEHGKEGLSPSDLQKVEAMVEAYRD